MWADWVYSNLIQLRVGFQKKLWFLVNSQSFWWRYTPLINRNKRLLLYTSVENQTPIQQANIWVQPQVGLQNDQ